MARRRSSGGRVLDMKQWGSLISSRTEQSTQGLSLLASLAFAEPATILRLRGFVQAGFDETVQAGDTMHLQFGIGVVSTDAATAGSGSMPDPEGDPEYPWLWWGGIELEAFEASATAGQVLGSGFWRLEIDSKAMRRVKPGQSLVILADRLGVAGAPVVVIHSGTIRVLIGT